MLEVITKSEVTTDEAELVARLGAAREQMLTEMHKVIVAQDEVLTQLIFAVLCRGHCLLEGVPGLAKTVMVQTLGATLNLTFRRIQFTPDLMPSDITGTDIIQEDPQTGRRQLEFLAGPDLHQFAAGGRNQPHASQDPSGAAGSDAGAAHDVPGHGLTTCPILSSCWPRRTRSSRKAPTRCPKPNWTGSCSW